MSSLFTVPSLIDNVIRTNDPGLSYGHNKVRAVSAQLFLHNYHFVRVIGVDLHCIFSLMMNERDFDSNDDNLSMTVIIISEKNVDDSEDLKCRVSVFIKEKHVKVLSKNYYRKCS